MALRLPRQPSVDRLSPDDVVNIRRLSVTSVNQTNGRRGSTMSTFTRRSVESAYDVPMDEIPDAINEEQQPEKEGTGRYNPNDSVIHEAIPSLPVRSAVICLTMNVIFPGSGTVFSGVLAGCYGESYFPPGKSMETVVCTNLWVGLSQLLTIPFFLVGWFWSLAWGVYLVQYALDKVLMDKRNQESVKQQEIKEKALKAFKGQMMFSTEETPNSLGNSRSESNN